MVKFERAQKRAVASLSAAPIHPMMRPDIDVPTACIAALETAIASGSAGRNVTEQDLSRAIEPLLAQMQAESPAEQAAAIISRLMNTAGNRRPFVYPVADSKGGMTKHEVSLLEMRLSKDGQLGIRATDQAKALVLHQLDLTPLEAIALSQRALSLALEDGDLHEAQGRALMLAQTTADYRVSLLERLDQFRAAPHLAQWGEFIAKLEKATRHVKAAASDMAELIRHFTMSEHRSHTVLSALNAASDELLSLLSVLFSIHEQAAQVLADGLSVAPPVFVDFGAHVVDALSGESFDFESAAHEMDAPVIPKQLDLAHFIERCLGLAAEELPEVPQTVPVAPARSDAEWDALEIRAREFLKMLAEQGDLSTLRVVTDAQQDDIASMGTALLTAAFTTDSGTSVGEFLDLPAYTGDNITTHKEHQDDGRLAA